MSQQISCVNRKISYNRYSHEPYLQNCGHCFPCQLRKRNHYLNMLFNEISKQYKHSYFLTLTFDDKHILYVDSILHKNVDNIKVAPYSYSLFFAPQQIDKLRFNFNHDFVEELIKDYSFDAVHNFRFDLSDNDFNHLFGTSYNSLHLDHLYSNKKIQFDENNNYRFRTAYFPYKASALYLKRLRKSFSNFCKSRNLQESKITYFCVQEYGPKTLRPHFHLLLLSNSDYFPNFLATTMHKYSSRKNIYKHDCWKFGFVDFQRINVNEKVSTYIAGYINGFQLLPSTHVQQNLFTTKHSHSKSLGFDNDLYNDTRNWFKSVAPYFKSEINDFRNLLEDKYITNCLAKNVSRTQSEILAKYPAFTSRLFPKFPFSFLSMSKYSYQLLKECLKVTPDYYKSILYSNDFTRLSDFFPLLNHFHELYLNFMRDNYHKFSTKTFTSKSFNSWYLKLSGDLDFDYRKQSTFVLRNLYLNYYVHRFKDIWYHFVTSLKSSFASIFPDYTSIDSIKTYYKMYVFANDMRDRFLFKRFYPQLIDYMGENNYSFDDVAPLFYPTNFEANNLTNQISKYLISLIPDYTKHRAIKEPKY